MAGAAVAHPPGRHDECLSSGSAQLPAAAHLGGVEDGSSTWGTDRFPGFWLEPRPALAIVAGE